MMDLSKFTAIHYLEGGRSFGGCDCWGLVVLIYKELLGIELDLHSETPTADLKRVSHQMEKSKKAWREVEVPMRFDLVGMRSSKASVDVVCHVGVMVNDTHFIHIQKDHIHPVVVSFSDDSVKYRIKEFRRYAAGWSF